MKRKVQSKTKNKSNQDKKMTSLIVLLVFFFIALLYLLLVTQALEYNQPTKIQLLKFCPDKWYINDMPSNGQSLKINKEYFIYQGVRREISEFDLEWIEKNCPIRPQYVY